MRASEAQRVRRALLMASGANRGAWYAGFMGPFRDAGIDFDLMAGVSAGGIASAWFAAGDEAALVRSWREADAWRVAFHPWLARGRRRTVDQLIRAITLTIMDLDAVLASPMEVRIVAARIAGRTPPLPRLARAVFSTRELPDAAALAQTLRATAFVPLVNGCTTAVTVDGERYLDGGLVGRVPMDVIPERRFDEIWVAACSPNGIRELSAVVAAWRRPERLVVITPSRPLPVGRWTMEWARIGAAIELGRNDMREAVAAATSSPRRVTLYGTIAA